MTDERKEELQRQRAKFRNDLIDLLHSIQTDHSGGSLSCTETLTSLYFETMNVNSENSETEGRDYLILSKGHVAPMLYLMPAEKGFFPEEELKTLRQIDSVFQGHPYVHKTLDVELSTGPLGLRLSASLDMATANRIKGLDSYTRVIMDDGEVEEGCIREAAIFAFEFGTDHLIGILDNNGARLDSTLEEIMPMGDIGAKWRAFGWSVITCSDHDVEDLYRAVEQVRRTKDQPSLVLVNAMKGKDVSFMEGKNT